MKMSKRFCDSVSRAQWLFHLVGKDHVAVYAAQASCYIMISAVPFVSLLFAIVSSFIPADFGAWLENYMVPAQLKAVLDSLIAELEIVDVPSVSLLSISALTTLWSASRGTAAIRTGVESVYHTQSPHGYWIMRIKSLLNTIVFMALIVLAVALLLFGDFLLKLIGDARLSALLGGMVWPLLMLFMCAVFLVIYTSTARRSDCVKKNLLSHLPGAIFAALGWIAFSFGYAIYIEYFPNAGRVYGGLAALCLMMLWLYFCMMILLYGAEINKVYFAWRDEKSMNWEKINQGEGGQGILH